jgi:hypothetical protein
MVLEEVLTFFKSRMINLPGCLVAAEKRNLRRKEEDRDRESSQGAWTE